MQRHLAQRVSGTGQAGVVSPHRDFNLIQQRFGQFLAVQIAFRHLANRFIHRLVVVGGGDNQVGLLDQAILVHPVMVEQGAAWRFDHADPLPWRHFALGHQLIAENIGIEQQVLDRLNGMEQLNHPRPVISQCDVNRLALAQRHEFLAFLLGQWGGDEIAIIDPGQRPDPIPTLVRPQRVDERKFHVAPRLDLFAQYLGVTAVVEMIKDHSTLFVFGP